MIRTISATIVILSLLVLPVVAYATASACPPTKHTTDSEPASKPLAKPTVIDLKNDTCPVMGGQALPDVYVDYQGLRIHFCCSGCDTTFEKSPKKYLAKLGITDIEDYKRTHAAP